MALIRATSGSSGGGGTITFSEVVAPPSNNTSTLTVDGTASAYIVNTATDYAGYKVGCSITSVNNGTFSQISSYEYGADLFKTWAVIPTVKGSTVTITFGGGQVGSSQAFKWIDAVN